MTSYSLTAGESDDLASAASVGESFIVRSDDRIRVSLSREYTDKGTLILGGDRAVVAVPPRGDLWVYAENAASIDVFPNGVNGLAEGDELEVRYIPTSESTISGTIDSNVTDRQGRNLGKIRLMDSGNTLIDTSNPLPIAEQNSLTIGTWNAGTLTVTDDGSFNVGGTVAASVSELTGNQSGVHTQSLAPSSGGDSFNSQSVPDGKKVTYLADPGNGSNIDLDGTVPIEPGASIELAVSDVSAPTFNGDGSATMYAIVEV